MDPSRSDAAAVPPASFLMPLPQGGYQCASAPNEAKSAAGQLADGGVEDGAPPAEEEEGEADDGAAEPMDDAE